MPRWDSREIWPASRNCCGRWGTRRHSRLINAVGRSRTSGGKNPSPAFTKAGEGELTLRSMQRADENQARRSASHRRQEAKLRAKSRVDLVFRPPCRYFRRHAPRIGSDRVGSGLTVAGHPDTIKNIILG